MVKLTEDATKEVRDSTLALLGKMKGLYPPNFFGKELQSIDKKKMEVINSYIKDDSNINNNGSVPQN